MRFLLASLCFMGFTPAGAQMWHSMPQLSYSGMMTYSRLHPDAFSFYTNPAALGNITAPAFGFTGSRPFMLPDVTTGALSAALPAGKSRMGFSVHHTAGMGNHNSRLGFSFAQTLGEKANLGASFQYQTLAVAGYRRITMLGVSLGGTLQLDPGLQAGFTVLQPAAAIGKNREERMAALYCLGLGVDLSESFFLTAALQHQEGMRPGVQAACSYQLGRGFRSRLGVNTAVGEFFFGGGFETSGLQLDVFTALHPQLGFSPGLGIIYTKPKQP